MAGGALAEPGRPAGTLRAVNVGMPKDVPWQGQTVYTGVWKDAVAGPRRVRRLNVDGDGQGDLGGHGGEHRAVFVYQLDSYRHWQRARARRLRPRTVRRELHRRRPARRRGVHRRPVPDRRRAVRGHPAAGHLLPRRHPDGRPPDARAARVAPPAGLLLPGARGGRRCRPATRSSRSPPGPEQMTVAEIDALLYLPGHPRQQLLRALRIPALSAGLAGVVPGALDGEPGGGNAGLVAASPPPAWPGFRPLRGDRDRAGERHRHLDPPRRPGRRAAAGAAPGPVPHPAAPARRAARRLLRSYSLSGPPGADDYRISVKREPTARAAATCTAGCRSGDQLEVAAPRGTFILRPDRAPVLLISAGVGATPVLAMLHALARRAVRRGRSGGCTAPATAPSTRSPPRPAALLAVAAQGARPRLLQPARPDRPRRPRLRRRRPAVGRAAGASSSLPRDAEAYLCGPAPFMRRDQRRAGRARRRAARIHTEMFGPAAGLTPGIAPTPARAPHPPAGPPGDGPHDRVRAQRPDRPVGAPATAACSSSPRRATCRPLVVPHRRLPQLRDRPSSPAPSTTAPTPSTHPPTATR